eukprot:scaffold1954_cov268-Pinguiococcus_pyrenoidosus.AAC.215
MKSSSAGYGDSRYRRAMACKQRARAAVLANAVVSTQQYTSRGARPLQTPWADVRHPRHSGLDLR